MLDWGSIVHTVAMHRPCEWRGVDTWPARGPSTTTEPLLQSLPAHGPQVQLLGMAVAWEFERNRHQSGTLPSGSLNCPPRYAGARRGPASKGPNTTGRVPRALCSRHHQGAVLSIVSASWPTPSYACLTQVRKGGLPQPRL